MSSTARVMRRGKKSEKNSNVLERLITADSFHCWGNLISHHKPVLCQMEDLLSEAIATATTIRIFTAFRYQTTIR